MLRPTWNQLPQAFSGEHENQSAMQLLISSGPSFVCEDLSTSASCPARTLEAYILVPLTPHNTPSGVRFDSPDMVAPTCKTYFGYWSSLWLLLLVVSPHSCCTHNLEEWKKLSSSPLEDLISITTTHDVTVSTLLRFNSFLGRFGRKPLFENLMCVCTLGIDEAGGENIRLDQLCQS